MNYSRLTLYKNIQFPRDYSHILHFASTTEQQAFFNAQTKFTTYNDFLYIESSRKIVVNAVKGDLLGVNYLSFRNGDNNKYYYAFVDDLVYESDGSTSIMFTIDIMQTYMFDYELGNCDVEREHAIRFNNNGSRTNNAVNTLESPLTSTKLKYKHLKTLHHNKVSGVNDDVYFLVYTRKDFIGSDVSGNKNAAILPTYAIPITKAGGLCQNADGDDFATYEDLIRSGASTQMVSMQIVTNLPFEHLTITPQGAKTLITGVNTSVENGHLVLDLTKTPREDREYLKTLGTLTLNEMGYSNAITNKNTSFDNSKDNYYKKNCSQFKHIGIYTLGDLILVDPERCEANVTIELGTTLTSPMRQYIELKNYIYDNISKTLYSKYIESNSQVPIRVESFYSWLMNEGVSGVSSVISGAISQAGGKTSENIIAGTSAFGIGSAMIQAIIKPDNVINSDSLALADIQKTQGAYTYIFEASDDNINLYLKYFNKYGYQTNENKVPNYNTHYWFNYIKNVDTSIKNIQNMTHNTIEAIKQIYNNGVTLWHYNNGNYKWIDYECNNIERSIAT